MLSILVYRSVTWEWEGCVWPLWMFCESCFTCSLSFVMVDFSEQHLAVKFCFLLGKNVAETIAMFVDSLQGYCYVKISSVSGFHISTKLKCQLMSTSWTDKKCKKICTIVLEDRQCTIKEIKELSGITWIFIKYFLKIWDWKRWLQSLCLGSWLLIKKRVIWKWKHAMLWKNSPRTTQISFPRSLLVMNHGAKVMALNQGRSNIKRVFIWFLDVRVLVYLELFPRSDCPGFLLGGSEKVGQ